MQQVKCLRFDTFSPSETLLRLLKMHRFENSPFLLWIPKESVMYFRFDSIRVFGRFSLDDRRKQNENISVDENALLRFHRDESGYF